jgi:hypothetical protein
MKDFEINGLHFRFDNGCLDLMRKARGIEESNPLDGMTDSKAISVLILYGGLARVEVKQEKPVSRSLGDCEKLFDDFSPAETALMVNAWNAALSIVPEKNEVSEEGEKKSI